MRSDVVTCVIKMSGGACLQNNMGVATSLDMAEQTEGTCVPTKCSFCRRRYTDPKVLPCFHIFCRNCVLGMQVPGRSEVKCPEAGCRREFKIRDNDPETLPDAIPVYHRYDVLRLQQKLEMREAFCKPCLRQREQEAVAICDQCDFICQDCNQMHQQNPVKYSDHNIDSLKELSENRNSRRCDSILVNSRSMTFDDHSMRCKKHAGGRSDSYCMDCSKFICQKCIDEEHGSHTFYFFHKAAELRRNDLVSEQLPHVKDLHKRISNGASLVSQTRQNVEDKQLSLESSIEHTFNRLKLILERRQRMLRETLKNISEEKIASLRKQQAELVSLSDMFQRLEDFTESSLTTSTERELLINYDFMHDSISHIMQSASAIDTTPKEQPNMALKNTCEAGFKDLMHKHLNVFVSQAEVSCCSAKGEGLTTPAEMQRKSNFFVTVLDHNRKPCTSTQDLLVKLKTIKNDFVIIADVSDRGHGTYEVSYIPQFRGEHEISVMINGKYINGSPFPIKVLQPPYQLGRSQGIIGGLMGPRGACVMPNGNLLICEWNGGKIVELDEHGVPVRTFGRGELRHPASIAMDKTNHIYVVEGTGESRLLKYNSQGVFLKCIGKGGERNGEFKNPRGVVISSRNSAVYVCDRDNHRIQVFNTELEFQRVIDLHDIDQRLSQPCKPNDVAFDRPGNMYVTDFANHCVLCFTVNGRYLFSIGTQLSGPESITIDSNSNIYITESGNHRVSVFKTTGELVTRFGRRGKEEGELNFPMGIVVDSSGSVYVCELINNRIQAF